MSKWDAYFMATALETAKLSNAVRLKVGAVAVRDKRIICCGFNGTAPGTDNVCELLVEGALKTKDSVIHAEANLICHSAKYGISLNGCSLYITHAPCISCATLICAAGISEIKYKESFRLEDGLLYLKNSNITITKWSNE